MRLKRFLRAGFQNELAAFVHLKLLRLDGPVTVLRRRGAVGQRLSHVTHVDTEGELVT